MFAHQELDHLGVFALDAVLFAKAPYVGGTQVRMVTATAFGDVVKQCGRIQHPGLVPAAGQLRAKRVFV